MATNKTVPSTQNTVCVLQCYIQAHRQSLALLLMRYDFKMADPGRKLLFLFSVRALQTFIFPIDALD